MTTALRINTCARGCATYERLRQGLCNTCYQRERKAGRVMPLAAAAPAREHITALVEAGWNYNQISRAAGIDRSLIAFIMGGRERIQFKTLRAICEIHTGTREQHIVTGWEGNKRADQAPPRPSLTRSEAMKAAWVRRKAAASAAVIAVENSRHRAVSALTRARCGDCEQLPCVCPDLLAGEGTDLWIPAVADHDSVPDDFRSRAVCAQVDPEIFFPEKGGSSREAKQICAACEFRAPCLDYAVTHQERFGIWGGLSERERRKLEKGIA